MKKKERIDGRIDKLYRRLLLVLAISCLGVVAVFCFATNWGENVEVFSHKQESLHLERKIKGNYPMYYQFDDQWADKTYGSDKMEITGCGPTCLSMVWCGLTGQDKWTPYKVAQMAMEEGYYVEGSGSSWDLMRSGAEKLGLQYEELSLDENVIRNVLASGRPVICAMRPGDFTDEGHFVVLVGMDEDGNILVNDPNSKELSSVTWELPHLMKQMKNLWGYELK